MTGPVRLDLSGKTALVTGGSRGIGRAVAVELARAGARVAVNFLRNRSAAEDAAAAIRAVGPEPVLTAVGASKAALESVVRHLALEYGRQGLRINAVSPGVVETEALQHFPNRAEMVEFSRKNTPLGRLARPEDVARVVLWLASDHAEMIHGQTIVVDGGYSIVGWP